MKYRLLGSTGIKVSELGLGCEGFVGKDADLTNTMLDRAIRAGINCMDLYSPDPDLRDRIGAALRGRRDKFILQAHLCAIWDKGQYRATRDIDEVKASFEDMLARLDTDYVDIGMIHYVDSPALWEDIPRGEIMKYALELKSSGFIRSIGLSSHNPLAAQAAVDSGLIDVLMFSVNPCYDLQPPGEDCMALFDEKNYQGELLNMDPDRQRLYESCLARGVGITVMKAFGGGDLLSSDSPSGMALTVSQCLHYALSRPAVASVMCGAKTLSELETCLSFENVPLAERDFAAALSRFPRMSWRGHCMYCGHCAPCTAGIDIAAVTKLLNLAKAQGFVPETVREHYAALRYKASECVSCGMCEQRCPFGVPIELNMMDARDIFGR